jgi:exonuclease SbcC
MIPVQLTIQGLYSYQKKQTIDFTKLTTANLFGIFGSVGSGKSSILEAITFSIYGKTDRLNLSGDNRNYNMMNLKSDELLIDFIFETGKDQTAYRAVVQGKRNSKRFEDVKKLDRTAYRRRAGEWIPIEPGDLETAIGLSYDNFKRTIIIPQGQFQEFLQLGNKDRTQMLKELFNLGKFEMYYKVAALESKNNAQKQNIEGQLQQLGVVDQEQIKLYRDQLKEFEIQLKGQSRKLAEAEKTEEQIRQLQELKKKLDEAEKAFNELHAQESGFQSLEKKVKLYEQCVVQFKHLMDSLKVSAKKLDEREKQIKEDSEKLEKEEAQIQALNKGLEELKPVYEKRDELKQKADELHRLLRIKELEKAVFSEVSRLKKGTAICEDTVQKIKQLNTEKQQLEESIKAERTKLPDLALLSNVKAWFVEKHNLDKQIQERETEIKKYNQEEKVNGQEIMKVLAEPVFVKLPSAADYSVCAQYLQDKTSEIKAKIKVLDEQANHLQVKVQLKHYAEDLENGKPCPLCGSIHHPELFKTDNVREAQEKLSNERQGYDKEIEQINGLINRLSLLENQRQFTVRFQKELAVKKVEQQKKVAAHIALFIWEKYKEEAELTKAFFEAERIQQELKKKEAALESVSGKLAQEEKHKERYQGEVEKIKNTLTVYQTELKTIGEQLKLIKTVQYQQISVADIETEKASLLQEHRRIEKDFTEKSALLIERTKRKDTLGGSLMTSRKEMEQDRLNIADLNKQLDEQLAKSSFQSLEEISTVLSVSIDLEVEKQKLTKFKEQVLQRKSQKEELLKQIGARVYDAEVHRKLISDITSFKAQITQKNQEIGKITELLKKLQKDLESQAKLRKEFAQLELRADNIKTMKSLFKASGFVNYISSVYLQNLCNAANDRFFQLTRQKLSLEITSDNNFQVRDFLNGGKVRSVKTLSGGQTFQAALSLALALADNIQKITESNQNFFFLDEGFGSLDKEALSVVFDTLKSLRKENRIVGVISHVEEMQQEIDVHLRIENLEEEGSLIYSSWEKRM